MRRESETVALSDLDILADNTQEIDFYITSLQNRLGIFDYDP